MNQKHSPRPKKTKGRDICGVLLLNKPINASSNHALQQCKRLFKAAKAGHTGSLDPLATGMLPICFGRATKFSAYLLNADKQYVVTAQLGVKTTTGDLEGEALETKPVPELTESQIKTVLKNFEGERQQIPPMYSALKHQGKPLYQLAREGKSVVREPRPITLYSLALLAYQSPYLTLQVHCSKGTYIRTLAEDIGDQLGCGATVSALHRTSVGHFSEDQMVEMQSLNQLAAHDDMAALDAYLLSLDAVMKVWPEYAISASEHFYLQNGRPVETAVSKNTLVRLYLDGKRFLGLGEIQNNRLTSVKLL